MTAEAAREAWMKDARDFDTAFDLIVNSADDTVLWHGIATALEEARNEGRAEASREHASRLSAEARGDGPCMDCDTLDTPVWLTDNVLWNRVVGGEGTMDDPGGLLCPICFISRAERSGLRPIAWHLTAKFPWRWAETAEEGQP